MRGYLFAESIPEARLWMKFLEFLRKPSAVCMPPHPYPLSRAGARGTEVNRVVRETERCRHFRSVVLCKWDAQDRVESLRRHTS